MNVRILGVGQLARGDDAAGLEAAALLRGEPLDGVEILDAAADAAALLAQIEGAAGIVAIDCARGGGAPGSIVKRGADIAAWPQLRASSSHGNALAGALALGDALGCLPSQITVFAVVGQNFTMGGAISPAVAAALPELARQAMREATCMKRG